VGTFADTFGVLVAGNSIFRAEEGISQAIQRLREATN